MKDRYKVLAVAAPIVLLICLGIEIFAEKEYFNSSYSYKILDIEYLPGHRGSPSIKVDTGSFFIESPDLKILPYIKKGDSVVKQSKSKNVKIYRRNENGKMTIKIIN